MLQRKTRAPNNGSRSWIVGASEQVEVLMKTTIDCSYLYMIDSRDAKGSFQHPRQKRKSEQSDSFFNMPCLAGSFRKCRLVSSVSNEQLE